jgi:hypothetical protein
MSVCARSGWPPCGVAVAEKLPALRTEDFFRERAARGDVGKALEILKRAGAGKAPMKGDKLPLRLRCPGGRREVARRARWIWGSSHGSTFGSPGKTEPPAGERIGLLADPNIS